MRQLPRWMISRPDSLHPFTGMVMFFLQRWGLFEKLWFCHAMPDVGHLE